MGVRLPSEYQEVEHIESTGTQYIDTGIIGKSGLKFSCKLSISRITLGSPFFGCYGNGQRCYLSILNSTTGNIGYSYMSSTYSNTEISANTFYDMETDFSSNNQSLKIDGETVLTTENAGTLNTRMNVFLFGYNFSGKFDKNYPVYIKLHSATIYDGDELVRNFIPCYRKSDNKIGMYDTVTDTFYTNQGTGAFLKGNDVNYEPIDMLALRRMVMMGHHKTPRMLAYWLSGEDASVNGRWYARVGDLQMQLYGGYAYDNENYCYDFGQSNAYARCLPNSFNFTMGHHFTLEVDMDIAMTSKSNTSEILDVGSVTNASHAIGFGFRAYNNNPCVTINWKLNGNDSNPGLNGISNSNVPTAGSEYHRVKAIWSIVDGGDGYDRAVVSVNGLESKPDIQVPKAYYAPTWNQNYLYIARGVMTGYDATMRLYDLKIYVID